MSPGRLARWTALGTTLLFALYILTSLGSVPAAWRGAVRTVGAVMVAVWYFLVYQIVKRVALEWRK